MNPAQQIEKLRGHVLIFSEHLRYLIQTFQVLLPMAQNDALLDSFSGTKRARGFLVMRAGLMQQCLIGITKFAYDTEPKNPTVNRMTAVLLNPATRSLRAALKSEFAVPIKPAPDIEGAWSAQDEEMWQQAKSQEIEELSDAFEDQLKRIDEHRKWFAAHHQKFKDLRDKHLAHLDISKVGKTYILRKVAGPEWGVIKEAVQRLIEMAELLLNVLHRKDESFGQFSKLAKRDANDFWKIKPRK
jgi:hypothetical protein